MLYILGFLILAIGTSNVTGLQYLVPTQRQKYLTISVCIGAIVNLSLNFFLIQRFQAIGAAIASVIAESSVAISQLLLVRDELSIRKITQSGLVYFIAASIMLLCVTIIASVLSPSILHTLFIVLSGVIVYCVILLILKDNFFMENAYYFIRKMYKFFDKK